MSELTTPEFIITAEEVEPGSALCFQDMANSVLGLRERAERSHAEHKRLENHASEVELQLLSDFIAVTDVVEDQLRMISEGRRSKRQKELREILENTLDAALHILEKWGVYRVDIMGRTYRDVEFKGVVISEPWEVVSKTSGRSKEVRKVLRSLWVRVVGNRLAVLRRAQVVC